jgi:hypothetical protein
MRIVKFKNGVETVLLKDYTTFPRWNSHCASRILLNLKNLLVYRGINETNTMIGPIEYFGQIDPYSSIFYPDKNKEILPDPPFFNCQKFEWKKNSIGN